MQLEKRSLKGSFVPSRDCRFYLSLRSGETFGPFNRTQINLWVRSNILSPHALVFEDGDSAWKTLSEINGLFENGCPSAKITSRIKSRRELPFWWNDEVTPKQIARLDYYEIPYEKLGLTKGRASELIDFMKIADPVREEQYQNSPASEDQLRSLHEFGYQKSGLTYREAKQIAFDLRHLWEIEFFQREPIGLGLVNAAVNDPECRALHGYGKIPKKELRIFLRYLRENIPNWRLLDVRKIASFVPSILPHRLGKH
jgi:hypothetical protein